MKKGDKVFYINDPQTRSIVRAKVITAHKDGSVTVQAQMYYRDGKDVGQFLGYTYRLDSDDVFPNAKAADDAIGAYVLA